jgi:hypothetical protein
MERKTLRQIDRKTELNRHMDRKTEAVSHGQSNDNIANDKKTMIIKDFFGDEEERSRKWFITTKIKGSINKNIHT